MPRKRRNLSHLSYSPEVIAYTRAYLNSKPEFFVGIDQLAYTTENELFKQACNQMVEE